jgi:hypothetical protein
MRGCLQGLLILVILLVVLAGAGYYFFTRPSDLAKSLATVPASTAAAQSFDNKIATLQAAPPSTSTQIEISEQEATSKLVETLAEDPSYPKIENPQVTFRGGKVIVSGMSHDAPIPITIVVVGTVSAREGKLVTNVERIDTGRFPLPGPIQQQITDLATNTEKLNESLPITVDDVQTLEGRLLVTGKPK